MVCCPAPSALQDEIAKNWLQAFDQVRYGAIMSSEVTSKTIKEEVPFLLKDAFVLLCFPPPSSIAAAGRSVPAISDCLALPGDGREELPSVDEGGCRVWPVSCGAVSTESGL